MRSIRLNPRRRGQGSGCPIAAGRARSAGVCHHPALQTLLVCPIGRGIRNAIAVMPVLAKEAVSHGRIELRQRHAARANGIANKIAESRFT